PLLPRLPGLPPRARAPRRGRAERHAAQAPARRPARRLPRARRRAHRAARLREPAGAAPAPAGDERARSHAPLLPGRRPGRHPRRAPRRRRARARGDGDALPRVPVRGLLHRRSRRAADRAGAGAGRSGGAAAGRVSLRPATPAEPLPGEAPWVWGMTRYQWLVLFAAWLGWGFDVFDGLLFNLVAPVCLPRLLGVAAGGARVGAAAGASLVAEVVPERRRVAAGALLYTSSPLGIFLATLVNDLFTKRIPLLAAQPDLAWRLVFLTGLLPAAVALWIRRRVREPEVWEREAHAAPRLAELFAPGLRHATLGGLAMCIVTLVAWWGTNAFLPLVAAFLAGPHASPSERAGFITYASTMFNLGGLVGTLATIPVSRLGRRTLFALYLAGGAASIWVTFGGDWEPTVRMRLFFL